MKRWIPWLSVAGWTLFIYATIPLARSIQGWVDRHLGRTAFLYLVLLALLVGFWAAFRFLRRQPQSAGRARWCWLTAIALALAAGSWQLRANPEEAMHVVQYGVLSLLLYRALRPTLCDPGLYVVATLAGATLGVLDEVIQWMVPGRFFDFRDMGINVLAVALVQLALARGIRPAQVTDPVRAPTLRIALRVATTLALLLSAVLSATPARLAALPDHWPVPRLDEAPVEYGYSVQGPDGLHFVSRFSGEQLRMIDAVRGEEVGVRLQAYAGEEGYRLFLAHYPPSRDPFAHELRVHLFRRDRYWQRARAARSDPEQHDRLITIAFREQEILERYFARALQASGQDWPPDLRERACARVRPGPYRSPVSAHLVVWAPESLVRVLPLIGLMAFLLWVRYVEARENKR